MPRPEARPRRQRYFVLEHPGDGQLLKMLHMHPLARLPIFQRAGADHRSCPRGVSHQGDLAVL